MCLYATVDCSTSSIYPWAYQMPALLLHMAMEVGLRGLIGIIIMLFTVD